MNSCGSRILYAVAVLFVALPAIQAQVYFPDDAFPPTLQRWFSSELHILEEPSLLESSNDTAVESYRFLWLRTFNQPIAVRLDIKADGTGVITTKVGNGESGFPYSTKALLTNVTRSVSRDEAKSFVKRVDEWQFWLLPAVDYEDHEGLDGSAWVIEAVKAGRYHAAYRWSPDNRATACAVHDLGLALAIQLAKVDVPNKEVY